MSALTSSQIQDFHRDGFVVARGLFDAGEIDLLRRAAKEDKQLDENAFGRADGEGGQVRLSLWNHPGAGIYGMIARCRRMVDSAAALLGGEVYHYHSKMIMKDARIGGAWTWHQDYGYWYQNGILFPLMCSAFVAVDPATRENGCLQVIPGSHQMGRIEHQLSGDQAGADMERVGQLLKITPQHYCEMQPGDTVFFHCNLLHRSDRNNSEHPRWSMICCYNAARNNPYKESHHPRYTPLEVVEDEQVRATGARRFADDDSDVAWLEDNKDRSARSLTDESSGG